MQLIPDAASPATSSVAYSKKILESNFDSSMGFAAPNAAKDLRHIRALAAQHGATMPTADQAFRNLATARAIGDDSLDWSAICTAQRLAAGLDSKGAPLKK